MTSRPPPTGRRAATRYLPLLSVTVGIGIGAGIVLSALTVVAPTGKIYWANSESVPSDADSAHPLAVSFHGANFRLWWPPSPPPGSASTGLTGVIIQVTEPSGVVTGTATGCGACGGGAQYWYSSDGSVGVSYTDGLFGELTVLVAV